MGARGPLPKPLQLKLLQGAKKRSSPTSSGIEAPATAPQMPAHLVGEAATEWRRLVPQLLALRLLSELDAPALALHCSAWQAVVHAETALNAQRQRLLQAGRDPAEALLSDQPGMPRRSPLAVAAAQARAECNTYLAALGLTPASRLRLPAPKVEAEDTSPSRFFKGPPP